jgi:hypothetical protein
MPEDKKEPVGDSEPQRTAERVTERGREFGYREGSNMLPDLDLPPDADAPSAMPVLDSAPSSQEPQDTQSSDLSSDE